MNRFKKIFGGMSGSNDPRYRTASPLALTLGCASSGGKMVFFVMMMMTGYVANTGFGVAVALTGILTTIKAWLDGGIDPFLAAIFDKMKVGKFGKIRVFLAIGYVIQAACAILMFNVLAGRFTGIAGVAVYIVLYFLFVIGYSVMSIGGTSIPTILTNDPKQRPFMNFVQMIYRYVGPILISNVLNLVVLPRYGNQISAEMLREACFWYCGFALLFVVMAFIGVSKVDTPEVLGALLSDENGNQKSVSVKDMLRMVRDNKPLRCYLVTGITDKIASNTNSQTVISTLLNGVLICSYQTANTLNNASTVIGFVFAFMGGVFIAKWGAKKATTLTSWVSIGINTLLAILCFVLGPTGMSKIGAGGFVMFLYMALNMGKSASTMILSTAEGMMRSDITDYELERSGNYMPGTVGAIYTFSEQIIASFGATIASLAVAAIGYTTTMPQLGDNATWSVLWVVQLICFGMPILGWLANIIAMKFYELDKERMVEVQTSIAERKKIARQAAGK